MIDLQRERLFSLSEAARLRPPGRRGRPTHTSMLYRWITRGLRGHRLEAIRLGGQLYTSAEALQRFADRLTAATGSGSPSADAPPRSSAAVDDELSRLGF